MERKILFKAKRLDNGEWVSGYFYKECDNTYIIEDRQQDSILNRNEAVLVNPSTVCQFTGLKDKNGKYIWEHDNVEVILAYILDGEVIYDDELCCFVIKPNDGGYYDRCISFKEISEMASYEEPAEIYVIRKEGKK